MPIEDKQARLTVMREIAKFDMNTSLLNVKVINHVVYMDGRISRNHGPNAERDLHKVLKEIEDICKSMPDIHDVVIDVSVD